METRSFSITLAALAMAAALAAACPASAAAPGRSCFWAHSVDGFRSIDNRTVYVRANMHEVFELKLFAPCLDVDWSHRIGLRTRGSSSICEGSGNAVDVIVRSTAHRQHCPVTTVRKLTPTEVAALPPGARP